MRSLRDDPRGVAAVLADLAPDVALLQEAPRLLGGRSACRRLARRAGLAVATGGAPAAGNLLLVSPRLTVVSSDAVRLTRRRGLHRRGYVTAVVELHGARLSVVGSHLDLDAAARLDTARAVRLAAPRPHPLVLCADVNEEPGGAAWDTLAGGLVDAGRDLGPTFPLRDPRRRIDALLVDPRLDLLAVRRPRPAPVTDHLPLVADLAWPPAGRRGGARAEPRRPQHPGG